VGVIVVGSVALDSVRTPFGEVTEALGGSATFFSVAASYFTDVAVVAVVGDDFPDEHVELLRGMGIDTSGLYTEAGKTFRWAGTDGFDLNDRDTVSTELNVFEKFRPRIPENLARVEYVFLANIDPELQRLVLDQMKSPALTACDTMNFWIERKREELLRTLSKVDVMVLNDAECRELAGEPNLIKASRRVLRMGPSTVIVKKGEHGALMFKGDSLFSAPAFPCESVYDPTGAGDAFAGGFMGHLAKTGDTTEVNIRRAIIYGTVMASFCVEQFSVSGMASLTGDDIETRFRQLKEVSHFET
jgi:sugar/nucleoside kinase (ribokinase family)